MLITKPENVKSKAQNITLSSTNAYLIGSDELNFAPFFSKSFSLPGVSVNTSSFNKYGNRLVVEGDTYEYEELNLEIYINENFDTYLELYDALLNKTHFNIWCIVFNNATDRKELFKVIFDNCIINNLSAVDFKYENEPGSVLSVKISYNKFRIKKVNNEEVI